jgi:hypothetical protein
MIRVISKFVENSKIFANQGSPPVSTTPVVNNRNNIRLLTPLSEIEEKKVFICLLYYQKVSKLIIITYLFVNGVIKKV